MPLLRYSLLRLLVLLAAFGVFWLVGLRGWPWLFVSVITAGAVSYLTMRTQRAAAVDSLAARAQVDDEPIQGDDEDAEDAVLDAAEREAAVGESQAVELQAVEPQVVEGDTAGKPDATTTGASA